MKYYHLSETFNIQMDGLINDNYDDETRKREFSNELENKIYRMVSKNFHIGFIETILFFIKEDIEGVLREKRVF